MFIPLSATSTYHGTCSGDENKVDRKLFIDENRVRKKHFMNKFGKPEKFSICF